MFNLLIIVTSDPSASRRPAEAIRIAAGVGAWRKVRVRLYLHHPFVASLADPDRGWMDEDVLCHYLPLVDTRDCPVLVPPGTGDLAAALGVTFKTEAITSEQLARVAADSQAVFTF